MQEKSNPVAQESFQMLILRTFLVQGEKNKTSYAP